MKSMFITRNILGVSRFTNNIYKNVVLKKHSFHLLQETVLKQSRNFSNTASTLNTVDLQNNRETANGAEQNKSNQEDLNYDAITKGNKEIEHKLKVIMLEAEVLRQEGHQIPPEDYMKPEMWEALLNLPSRSARRKHLEFLFRTSKKKENSLIKKLEKRKLLEEFKVANPPVGQKPVSVEEHASQYGLQYNNIFLRFHDATINRFYNSRLVQAMQFGQKLIIDCGYDQNMTRRENYNCAKQLMFLFSENRTSNQPFDIHYTNMNRESELIKMFHKYIPTLYDPEFPINTHEQSYLDLFPKENLVYLTPHCQEEMNTYDHDAIYIIGGIVDKINNEPLSLAKAKREGIKMKKFPLDKYLQWGAGSGKSLTLNQCVLILLDVKDTGDWNYALRHVPKRKLADPTDTNKSFFKNNRSWNPKSYKKPSYMKDVFRD